MNKKKRKCNFLYDFVKITGAPVAFVWLRPKVIKVGERATTKIKGGALVAANHTTFVDPIIGHCAFWRRRIHFIANEELFETKFKKWFFTNINCILISKSNFSTRSLHQVREKLKEGKMVMIFPEGAVNRSSEEVKTYKSGVILMAHLGKAPIIPIYIVRAKKWFERTKIVVGEPIYLNEVCGEMPTMDDIDNACALLHDREEQLRNYYEKNYIRKK